MPEIPNAIPSLRREEHIPVRKFKETYFPHIAMAKDDILSDNDIKGKDVLSVFSEPQSELIDNILA